MPFGKHLRIRTVFYFFKISLFSPPFVCLPFSSLYSSLFLTLLQSSYSVSTLHFANTNITFSLLRSFQLSLTTILCLFLTMVIMYHKGATTYP
ncbi:hypothetical protein BDC45DRAFT_506260 [Circinella umbellata]|nr:hypothetical protein BDC45DRAFT_506260 [Circinella umbellata]